MTNILKNKKMAAGILVLAIVVGLGVYGFLARHSDCYAKKGSVLRVWAPAYMEMGLFVKNALAPIVLERCGYVIEFRESEIDYREAARDVAAALADNPDVGLLMIDEGLARRLANKGVIAEPSAVLFSIEEETGLDFFGIALVKTGLGGAKSALPEALDTSAIPTPFTWGALIVNAQIRVPKKTLEKIEKGLDVADTVIKIANEDVQGIVYDRVKDAVLDRVEKKLAEHYIEKSVAEGISKEIAEQFGKAVAERVVTKINVGIGLAESAKDIYDILKESYELDTALADLEKSLARDIKDSRDRIGRAAEEALGLAFALMRCEAEPDEADQKLGVLERQAHRDYTRASDLAAEIHKTTGNQAEANRQMEINDKVFKAFGAAAKAAKAAIAARRAMGKECSLISLQPDPVDFGDVCIRDTKKISVRVKNFNEMEIRVRETDLNEWPRAPLFYMEGQRANYPLAAGEEQLYNIEYLPDRAGEHTATLSVNVALKILGEELSENRKVPVKGRGVKCAEESRKYPKLSFSPDPVDFGSVCIGDSKTMALTATNDGNYDLLDWKYLNPLDPFSVSPLPDVQRLSVGERHEYSVMFSARPGRAEDRFGVAAEFINEFGDKAFSRFEVKLRGQGIDCSPKKEEAVISPKASEPPAVPALPTTNKCEAVCGVGRVKNAATLAACSDISREFLCIQNKQACYDYLVPTGWQNDSGCCCKDEPVARPAGNRIDCSKFVGWDVNGFAVTKNPKFPLNSSTLSPAECK